jgi:hypothetical protein
MASLPETLEHDGEHLIEGDGKGCFRIVATTRGEHFAALAAELARRWNAHAALVDEMRQFAAALATDVKEKRWENEIHAMVTISASSVKVHAMLRDLLSAAGRES